MRDLLDLVAETQAALKLVADEASRYLAKLNDSIAWLPGADQAAAWFEGPLPDEGSPAALGGDWLASALDQNAFSWWRHRSDRAWRQTSPSRRRVAHWTTSRGEPWHRSTAFNQAQLEAVAWSTREADSS